MARGFELIDSLVLLAGLPREWARAELLSMAEAKGKSVDSLELEDVREILAEMLQDVLVAAKQLDETEGLTKLISGDP